MHVVKYQKFRNINKMPKFSTKKGKKSGKRRLKYPAVRKAAEQRLAKYIRKTHGCMYSYENKNHILNGMGGWKGQIAVPRTKAFCLRYADNGNCVSGLGGGAAGICGAEQTYILGSLFDPNLTITGHQPYYFDQLTNCGYEHYRVDYCQFKITALNPSTAFATLIAQVDAWNGSAGALAGVSWNTAMERPQTVMIKPEFPSNATQTYVSEWIPLWAVQGVSQKEYQSNPEYAALVTASPAKSPYLRLACCSPDGNNSSTMYVLVELIFKGVFYDPQIVAPS